jgi:hypothetical protein
MRRWRALRAAETGVDTCKDAIMLRIQTLPTFVKPLCIVLAFVLLGACGAQAKTCSPEDAEAADAAVDGLDSWTKIASVFKKYGHCDDGSIAAGNSEAVARLLVDQWATLPVLAKLGKRDPALKRFVLHHIDSTLDTDDLGKIMVLASSQCPTGTASLCSELLKAAARATK